MSPKPQSTKAPPAAAGKDKKVLVLSGGSVKGAFQAGAIKAVLNNGFRFDGIYGISVGSLNGAFIASEAGKQKVSREKLDWQKLGESLVDFWSERIRKPEDIIIRRSKTSAIGSVIFRNFKGLYDTRPIQSLVRNTISVANLIGSPVRLKVGAVNISDGEIIYAIPSDVNFIDYLLASSAIPIIMPPVYIGGNKGKPYLDGGIRDIAPVSLAIKEGATEIVCISCHALKLGGSSVDCENLPSLANRVIEIMVNEIINNEISRAEFINECVPEDGTVKLSEPFAGCRKVKLTVIRPSQPIEMDLENFDFNQVANAIQLGYETAMEKLQGFG